MPARVPLDVDLEDRLIYGLTPLRLGYAALGLLSAMAAWHSLPGPLGVAAALAGGLAGGALAWGRFGGRGLDSWVLAGARFLLRTYEVKVDLTPIRRLGARLQRPRRPRPRLARPTRRPASEWTPRRLLEPTPQPSLKVVGSWEADS